MVILFVMVMMISPAFAQEDSSDILATDAFQPEEADTETQKTAIPSPSADPSPSMTNEEKPADVPTQAPGLSTSDKEDSTAPTAQEEVTPSASPAPSASLDALEETSLLLSEEVMPMAFVPGTDITVASWDDFKASVEQAELDGKVIRIDAGLAGTLPGAITMNITHNNSIVIDGGGATFQAAAGTKAFTFNTTGSGSITLQNITLDGTGGAGGMLSFTGSAFTLSGTTIRNVSGTALAAGSGTITLNDCVISDTNGVGVSGGSNVIIKNTLFENVRNNMGGHGSAIYSSGNLTVEDSSFVNSASALDGGYIQGAIVAFGGSGRSVNVTRSYFKDNKASRYGGAIGFYQFGGNANISYNSFEGNGVSGKNANSDGGAIGVFNSNSGAACVFNIDNNTFIGNTSQDDGSAYFAESRNDTVVSNLTNNTFYANKSSKYFLSVADSGGVVQLSLDTVGHFKNNTFVGNTTSTAGVHGQGSAVGQHIDSANASVRPTATFENNIMIGNGGTNNAYRNVDIPDATDLGGNVGYDNGTALPASVTADAVFGTNPQPQGNNTHYGAVGKAGSGYTSTLKTVTILPNDGVTGLADNTAGPPAFAKDARGFTRDSANADAGAMEIKFVKFDANGGAWDALASLTYTGTHYYADDTASTGYFLVADPGGSVSVLSNDLPTNGTLTFAGWYTDPVGGVKITGDAAASDQTLYAHWEDDVPAVQYTITYYGNGSDLGTVPAMETYDENAIATIASPGSMNKTNAVFTGWNTSADGMGISYSAGQTFPIASDLELYAQWEENTAPIALYTLNFDSQGGSAVDSIHNIAAGSKVSAPTDPVKAAHTFDGWHRIPNCVCDATEPCWDFNRDAIHTDKTLYARWQPVSQPAETLTVTFDSQGGSAVAPIAGIVPGSKIAAPADPTRAGYLFRGWYLESDCVSYWYFDHYDVNQNLTLYAKWEPVSSSTAAPTDTTTGTTSTSGAPKTGDTNLSSSVWLIVIVTATILIVASVKLLRRRQDD